MPSKILVSACLMGQAVRYDGKVKPFVHTALERWKEEGRLVVICPEMYAGMPVPRAPAEIGKDVSAEDVLEKRGSVLENTGKDVSDFFRQGAENALQLAKSEGCQHALLIDGSPSCGSTFIYDGTFSGVTKKAAGVVATLLKNNGIQVWAPADIEQMLEAMGKIF